MWKEGWVVVDMSAINKRQWVSLDDNDLLVVLNKHRVVKGVYMLNSQGALVSATYSDVAGGWIDANEFELKKGDDGWVKIKGKILC